MLFQICPNFGATCLSVRILLLQDCIVMMMGGFPVPYGLGTGLMKGMECVDGAYTLCNLELARRTAPEMLTAPERTQTSYCPNRAKVYTYSQILRYFVESLQKRTSFECSLIVQSSSVSLRTLLFVGRKVESLRTGGLDPSRLSDSELQTHQSCSSGPAN